MSTLHVSAAAAAVMLAMLCGWAGHRLGTRRMSTLRTVIEIAVRSASHDQLTGLPNRGQLTIRLMQLDDAGEPVVLAIVNLDHFAVTNQWGYRVGDQLLVLQAARLRYTAGQRGGIAYRLVGDEFAVVWPANAHAAPALAAELLDALTEPVELLVDDYPVWVRTTATVGVTGGDRTGPGDPTSRLLSQANTALQYGKRTARGTAIVWHPSLPVLLRPRRDTPPRQPAGS